MSYSDRIIQRMFLENLEKGIRKGTLHITTPSKETFHFVGDQPGGEGEWHIHDWQVVHSLVSKGDIGLGETYSAGLWDSPHLENLFVVFIDNLDDLERYAAGHPISQFWFRLINTVLRRNSVRGSKQNIRSHYDVGNDFYRLWLDDTMTYSSAIYTQDEVALEHAQELKYQRILDRITPSRERILEIGCGWGGFAEQAAKTGHHLTGLTVSSEQHAFATKRLGSDADIRLQDYRHVKGKFDAIASIEMFEAVGQRYWPTYFSTLKERLTNNGVAMVQTITVKDEAFTDYASRSDYIRHYVFPGGMLPSIAKFKQSAEKSGLVCRDIFAFGKDYARTLKEWLQRFDANEVAIRNMGYGTEFIRSWRLYMSMCAASFLCERTSVIQVELAHA